MPMIIRLVLFAALLFPSGLQAKTLVINKIRATNSPYMLNLLKLALSYSDTEYTFKELPERLTKTASREALRLDEINVIWGGTSKDMEANYRPIRIDGYRGLMSMRFLIIRKGDQARFNNIRTLEDLKSLRFGQGRTWTDGKILEHSGLTVRRSTKKDGLYHMLDGGRFEAFPRGATEAWKEVDQMSSLPLEVEEKLIISYPLPTYFFVNKDNLALARDVENGLESAITDGTMDNFFYNSDRVRSFLKNAKLTQRRVIELNNPFLPEATPIDRDELWLTIDELIEGAAQFM